MIGIVHINTPGSSPYLKNYIDLLTAEGVPFELIFWDRENEKKSYPGVTSWMYSKRLPSYLSRISKIRHYIGFCLYARKIIRRRGYDKLIIMTTTTAQILYSPLIKRYKNKFFLDIRDRTYERYGAYRRREAKLVSASWATSISSEGFLDFLPQSDKYVIAHNLYADDVVEAEHFVPAARQPGQPIRIVFTGFLRALDIDHRFLQKLGKDERFELYFHGSATYPGQYEKFCRENGLDTVRFTGRYTFEEKPSLLAPAHLLYNYFKGVVMHCAMTNRYYDCLVFGIPLLSNAETFCGKRVRDNGLGITLDLDDPDFSDNLYNAFVGFDHAAFNAAREAEFRLVLRQQEEYLETVRSFIRIKDGLTP